MPNLLRPDIGKVRKRNFKPPKPKVKELDTPLMDQPFEYPLVHVSTWCIRDILKTLKRDTIYTMFNLINITKKNENLILNRLGLPAHRHLVMILRQNRRQSAISLKIRSS